MGQCTHCQQPVGCVGCVALDMVSYSAESSPQWNIQSLLPAVGYMNVYFCCCIPKAVHHSVVSTKKKGEVLEMHLWQRFPGSEWTDWVPEHRSVTGSSHITAHGKLKALLSLFSLDYWVSSIQRLCCAFGTYLPTGKSWLFNWVLWCQMLITRL